MCIQDRQSCSASYANLLDPLDQATADKASNENVLWADELVSEFKKAQTALDTCKSITIPRPSDVLWIVTDGSIKNRGIAIRCTSAEVTKQASSMQYCANIRSRGYRVKSRH